MEVSYFESPIWNGIILSVLQRKVRIMRGQGVTDRFEYYGKFVDIFYLNIKTLKCLKKK